MIAETSAPTPPDTSERRIAYQPALDGLRAFAVAVVIAYHLEVERFAEAGFLGVDTFFVLSGFLITTLLLTEWRQSGTIRFTAFWARRARRLLPALLLVLAAVALFAAISVPGHELSRLRGDGLATLFYGANWRFIVGDESYFALAGAASPLRHAWSLAIEEQFYLVWPLITFACLRLARGRRWLLGTVCVVGALASFVWMRGLFDSADPSRAYYGTDARAYQLLIGAALAVFLLRWAPRRLGTRVAVHVAGGIGALVMLRAVVVGWVSPSSFMVFSVAVAAVITSVVQPERTPLRLALSIRPIVWVGRISYGLYLWHWPVIVYINSSRTGLEGTELDALRLALTVALATASFYLVERPIRRGALRGRPALIFSPAAFIATALAVIVATAPTQPPPPYLRTAYVVRTQPVQDGAGTDPGVVRMLLIGDSMAASLIPGLEHAAEDRPVEVHAVAVPGCGIVRGLVTERNFEPFPWSRWCDRTVPDLHTEAIADVRPELVLWLSSWEVRERIVDGQRVPFGTTEGDRVLRALIDASAAKLTEHGARIVFLMYPPRAPNDEARPDPAFEERVEHVNRILREYAVAHPDRATVVDLVPIVCPGGPPCDREVDGIALRPEDGVHYVGDGTRYVGDKLMPLLLAEARDRAAPAPAPASP